MISGNELKRERERRIRRHILYAALIACYVAFHLFVISVHEPWRDEAQAWLIGKNMTLPEIFRDLSNEGHPCLWFLVIKAVSRLGLPYSSFWIVSLVFMTAAAVLLLYEAPFPLPVKVIVLAGAVFTYYNPVLTRSYCVTVLLVIVTAILYKRRERYPVLFGLATALLFQTHVLMAGLGLGLAAVTGIDALSKKEGRKGRILCLLIEAAGLAVLVLSLRQPSGSSAYIEVSPGALLSNFSFENVKYGTSSLFYALWHIPRLGDGAFRLWRIGLCLLMAALAVLICVVAVVRRKAPGFWRPALIALTAFGTYMAVVWLVYPYQSSQTATCLLMIVLFIAWIIWDGGGSYERSVRCLTEALLLVSMLATVPQVAGSVVRDYREMYSGSRDAADFIAAELPPESALLVRYDFTVPAVCAYLEDERADLLIWQADDWEAFRCYTWGRSVEEDSPDYAGMARQLSAEQGGIGHVYCLVSAPLTDEQLTFLHKSGDENITDETYWIYEVTGFAEPQP